MHKNICVVVMLDLITGNNSTKKGGIKVLLKEGMMPNGNPYIEEEIKRTTDEK